MVHPVWRCPVCNAWQVRHPKRIDNGPACPWCDLNRDESFHKRKPVYMNASFRKPPDPEDIND